MRVPTNLHTQQTVNEYIKQCSNWCRTRGRPSCRVRPVTEIPHIYCTHKRRTFHTFIPCHLSMRENETVGISTVSLLVVSLSLSRLLVLHKHFCLCVISRDLSPPLSCTYSVYSFLRCGAVHLITRMYNANANTHANMCYARGTAGGAAGDICIPCFRNGNTKTMT